MPASKIGEILLEKGMITEVQLQQALRIQELTGKKLGSILMELKYLDSRNLAQVLANVYKVPSITLENYRIKEEMADVLPEEYCRQKHLVPLQIKGKNLIVAMPKPNDYTIIGEIEFITNLTVTAIVAPEGSIDKAMDELFKRVKTEDESHKSDRDDYSWMREPVKAEEKESSDLSESVSKTISIPSLEVPIPEVDGSPAKNLSNINHKELESFVSPGEMLDAVEEHLFVTGHRDDQIVQKEISKAIEKGVSYVHFELNERGFEVKVRVLGELQTLSTFSAELFRPVIRELKERASLDPTSWRQPQKGFFKFPYNQDQIPITAHFLPYGDSVRVVLHLQQNFNPNWSLNKLGFSPEVLQSIRELLSHPGGIILFASPSGNGKTTTIYTALKELISEKKLIITYESPIRYRLNGVIQTESEDKHGNAYLSGLICALDQNPDVLYVDRVLDPGAIPLLFHEDSPFLKVFIRSNLESSIGAFSYFLELLRSPYALTTSVQAILAQRLINCLCNDCKSTYDPSPRTVERVKQLLGIENFVLYKSDGCESCSYTGFKGQVAIFELLLIDEKIKSRIATEQKGMAYPGFSELSLKKIFYTPETVTLMKEGLRKAVEGITTVAEVVRVIGLDNYARMIG
jgi:type IV pilus assembly protein PilB